jgi:hypothetical protein
MGTLRKLNRKRGRIYAPLEKGLTRVFHCFVVNLVVTFGIAAWEGFRGREATELILVLLSVVNFVWAAGSAKGFLRCLRNSRERDSFRPMR